MTDDQLDALEKRLRKHLLAGGGNGIFEAADAIASLRAKLAAEKTRADDAEVEEKNIRMAAHFFVEQRDAALAEARELRRAASKEDDHICQTLGKALGYPYYKDDQTNFPGATDANGVCVGEHVGATIAEEAAKRIVALQTEVRKLRALLEETRPYVGDSAADGPMKRIGDALACADEKPHVLSIKNRLSAAHKAAATKWLGEQYDGFLDLEDAPQSIFVEAILSELARPDPAFIEVIKFGVKSACKGLEIPDEQAAAIWTGVFKWLATGEKEQATLS